MKMYVVRKYHGHSSWIDPKHLAEYTEAEFETRHEALAHCERLKGKGQQKSIKERLLNEKTKQQRIV